MSSEKNNKIEFGDWQTPPELTGKICQLLFEQNIFPASVIEPTCGRGSFILSALETFPSVKYCLGIDISGQYLADTTEKISPFTSKVDTKIIQADFFAFPWDKQLESMPEPILVIGNPPWVTNSGLGSISGKNLPQKSNFQNHKGLDAITGKGNFDISESIIITMLENLKGHNAYLAMLCKTSVARKILHYGHKNHFYFDLCKIYNIDSKKYFDVAVDACLLCVHLEEQRQPIQCEIYNDISDSSGVLASFKNGRFIANMQLYEKWKHLFENEKTSLRWRSGIKHDCAKIMELHKSRDGYYKNALKEEIQLEGDYLFPMLKSSDLANGEIKTINRYMLVSQSFVGEPTDRIESCAPKTWQYIQQNAKLLDKRISIIYKNNPKFSIFGVGDYTFSDWKIAISGFYKNIRFRLIGPYEGKPVVFDDTCYFLSCKSEEQAKAIYDLLSTDVVKEFYSAYIWWDAKRPITLEILNMLSINKLADFFEKDDNYAGFENSKLCTKQEQLTMF
ncbi:MAG: SAM-dependent methyltransferase [Phycisphaerae bacterium]